VKPSDAVVSDYLAMRKRIGIDRTVVVQPSAYGLDNACTLDAMASIGPSARGIAVCNETTTDVELEKLHKAGIRGLRFFMLSGGAVGWDIIETMSARIAPLGWHIVLQLDGRNYPDHEAVIARLPSGVVFDHTGKFLEPVGLDHPGFQALSRLLKNEKRYLKLAAPYETSKSGPPFYADVGKFAKALVPSIPDRVIWASNWPHPSSGFVRPAARLGAGRDDATQGAGRQSGPTLRVLVKRRAGHEGVERGPELIAILVLLLQDFVLGAGQNDVRAGQQIAGECLDRRRRHHLIVTCRDDEDRLAQRRRIARHRKLFHRTQRRIGPGHRRLAEREQGLGFEHRGIAREAHRVGGQHVTEKLWLRDVLFVAAKIGGAAAEQLCKLQHRPAEP
jgi:D-galactarolactone isomerase